MTDEPDTFEREDRYIVIKRKHLSEEFERDLLVWLNAHNIAQVPRAVVVEGDWPEYEPVWRMVEGRVTDQAICTICNKKPRDEAITMKNETSNLLLCSDCVAAFVMRSAALIREGWAAQGMAAQPEGDPPNE